MQRGFTLLEVLVAIAVFAVMWLMSAQLLNNMIRQHDIIGGRGDELIELQRAMLILERDVGHIWPRSVRDQYGDRLGALLVDGDFQLEFTRAGWRNPLGHQRSDLQRVAYEHRDQTLYRYYWNVLDRAIDSEPLEQTLLEGVLGVEFEPLDGYGDLWVPANVAGSSDPMHRLAALSLRLETEKYGEISRLWEVPDSLDVSTSPAPGSPRPGGPGTPGSDTPGSGAGPGNGGNGPGGPGRPPPGNGGGRDISADPPRGDGP